MAVVANEYLESQVLSATPYRLHLMVVDGAIRFARLGQEHLGNRDWEGMYFALNRAREFVTELLSGIDEKQSPEISSRMKQLLTFVYRNLTLADIERNPRRVDDALVVLESHRASWFELGGKLSASHLPAIASPLSPAPQLASGPIGDSGPSELDTPSSRFSWAG